MAKVSLLNSYFVSEIKKIMLDSRENAVKPLDLNIVLMNWQVGKHIFKEKQLLKIFPIANAVRSQLNLRLFFNCVRGADAIELDTI